jgi:spermidine synthase
LHLSITPAYSERLLFRPHLNHVINAMSSKHKNKLPAAAASLEQGLSWLDKAVFYGTVSITGASVMMIELLGTRVIGPFYGVSLIVWSSLLSVSLLALALGYYAGGAFADSGNKLRLPHALLLAAFLTGVIPVISETVQLFFDPLGLRWGALSSAFVLFTAPLFFLGMAGPFIIRMATRRIENVGSTAGNVYAISTIGSVVGTLLLGFYLLPLFGTHVILLSIALILALLAVAIAQYENLRLQSNYSNGLWALGIVLLLLLLGWQLFATKAQAQNYQVQFEAETHYGWVRVVDQPERDVRWLMSDASTIGAESLASGEGLLAYQRVVSALPWFNLDAKEALLIGLGAGHLVNEFTGYGLRTDSIEIDPAVAEAAKKYFSYRPSGELWVGDARYSIKKIRKQYDLIVHDCFTGGAEPFHLLSQEMIVELKRLLKPDGMLVVNFVGFTQADKLKPVQSIARTLDAQFGQRRVFISMPGESFNDYIFVMSDAPLELEQRHGVEHVSAFLQEREVSVDSKHGELITDDYNPLEFLQIAKAEYYRNILVERVGRSLLFR